VSLRTTRPKLWLIFMGRWLPRSRRAQGYHTIYIPKYER
jgi:hypothetical protein